MMQSPKFDHIMVLKLRTDMIAQIDRYISENDRIKTRSEFLRVAAKYALDSLDDKILSPSA